MPTPDQTTADHLVFYDSLLHSAAPKAARIRASNSVIPWRLDPDGEIEVWWVRRAPTMRFMGGFWAFPGGGLSRRDAQVPVASQPQGTSEDTFSRASPELDDAGMRALGADLVPGTAAGTLRELFEETGLLLLKDDVAHRHEVTADRIRLLRKDIDFAAVAQRHGAIDASQLVFAGRWLTPPFAPMRYDNRFFLLRWPSDRSGQPELVDPDVDGVLYEHDRCEWVKPQAALERWRASKLLTAPPILHILRVLAEEGAPTEQALGRLREPRDADLGPIRKIEFLPGIVVLPLRTPTLPPATHTNAFLLGFPGGDAVLIDPATSLPEEQVTLLRVLDAAREQGYNIGAIWLSHHHPDHVGAAEAVREHLKRQGVLLFAHGRDAATLQRRGIWIDGELEDGQMLVFGEGDKALTIQVIHTPGHTRGHLSFYLPSSRALLASDLISTLSTIVIDPPDGDMDQYLSSLRKVALLDAAILFPSHGPALPFPTAHLEEVVRHRMEREEKILTAWRDGLTSAAAMVSRVYDDVPAELHPVAERQIEAHLVRLHRGGRIS